MKKNSSTKLAGGTKLFVVTPKHVRPGTACSHFLSLQLNPRFAPQKEITLAQHTTMMQIYGATSENRWNVWTGKCTCVDILFGPFYVKGT